MTWIVVAILVVFLLLWRYEGMESGGKKEQKVTTSTVAIIDVPPHDSSRPSMYVPSPYLPSYTRRWLVGGPY